MNCLRIRQFPKCRYSKMRTRKKTKALTHLHVVYVKITAYTTPGEVVSRIPRLREDKNYKDHQTKQIA